MGSIEKKLDTMICVAALIGVFALFVSITVPSMRRGLSSADDAAFAVVAKNVAFGKGYGLPRSTNDFVLFDPGISTGPPLILPLAFLIRVFGQLDLLPAGVALVIFIGQLIAAAIILARRFGWTPTCGFLAAMLWLLMLASVRGWYFGAFLGEPAAFGFTLIGCALLAVARRDRAIIAAGLCFSLAFLTKQISLFAVAGVVGGWLIVSVYNRDERKLLFRRLVILVLIGLSLPVAFEVTKLVTLGLNGYLALLKLTLSVTASHAVGTGDQSGRLTTFWKVLKTYVSVRLWVGLAIGSAILIPLSWLRRGKGDGSAGRFAIFAWTGAATYLAYILMFSVLWTRYFWIGVAVMSTAICAPLLGVQSRFRVATLLVLLVAAVGFGLHPPFYGLGRLLIPSEEATERAAVVRVLDAHPDLPYVGPGWTSVYDVLYLRRDEGTWSYDPNVINLDREFIALINVGFADGEDQFVKTVLTACDPLTPEGRLTAYRCGERFRWTYRLDPGLPSKTVGGPPVQYSGVVDRRDCETVAGWVMNNADLEAHIKVELYIDRQLAETVPAQNPRPDLSNHGGTGRYGFSFKLPAAYKDERPHTANVKVAGSASRVPFYEGVFAVFQCKP